MTARFERLSIIDGTILASMLAIMALFGFPNSADAHTENKTSQVFEIKNLPTIKLPELPKIQLIADIYKNSEKVEMVEVATKLEMVPNPAPLPVTEIAQVLPVAKAVTLTSSTSSNSVPPKKTGADRVFMQEPEIRAYVCPRLGDKCNTFIAILKAENGTHECTRDNRGLNRNGSIDIGLAQINWKPGNPWHTFENLQDCKYNLDVALEMYSRRGFQPWYAYTKGAYKKHLPAVLASAQAIEAKAIEAAALVETAAAAAVVN